MENGHNLLNSVVRRHTNNGIDDVTENGAIRLRSAPKIGNRESSMRGSRIRGPFGLKKLDDANYDSLPPVR